MSIRRVLKVLGIIVACIVVILAVVVFSPIVGVEKQPIALKGNTKDIPANRQDVNFTVDGLKISGWLYLPEGKQGPVPCVILNSGFAGTKDFLLEEYALRFVEVGFASLSFDYRYFGDSEGEPRQFYSVNTQLEDLKTAVRYVRSRPEIDPKNIFIWGTSSSGNFGVILASEDEKIAGVIGQSPSMDGEKDGEMIVEREGIGWMLKLILNASKDKGRSRFGLSPNMIPAVGLPGTTAMLTAPGTFEGYRQFAEKSKTFRNEVCARLMFESHGPDLLKSAKKVNCPVQFHICEKDKIVDPNASGKIEKILGDNLRIIRNPIDHFEIYTGDYFEKSIREQIAFVRENTI